MRKISVALVMACLLAACPSDEPAKTGLTPSGRGTASSTATDVASPPPTSSTASPTDAPSPPPDEPGPDGGPVPPGFRPIDSTFLSPDEGWFLGDAPCDEPPCTSIVRTQDGGETWEGIPAPVAIIADPGGEYACGSAEDGSPLSGPCVSKIRFADELNGYVFEPSMYETHDGGATWTPSPGSWTPPTQSEGAQVSYLEASGGTAVRIATRCPGTEGDPCFARVERASVDGGPWETLEVRPGRTEFETPSLTLSRRGEAIWLRHVDYGAYESRHWVSADGGTTWRGTDGHCVGNYEWLEPLDENHAWLYCGSDADDPSTADSTEDGGVTWHEAGELPDGPGAGVFAALTTENAVYVSRGAVYLTDDGARTWRASATIAVPDVTPIIGFVDARHGRVLDEETVWFTEDGGDTWREERFE